MPHKYIKVRVLRNWKIALLASRANASVNKSISVIANHQTYVCCSATRARCSHQWPTSSVSNESLLAHGNSAIQAFILVQLYIIQCPVRIGPHSTSREGTTVSPNMGAPIGEQVAKRRVRNSTPAAIQLKHNVIVGPGMISDHNLRNRNAVEAFMLSINFLTFVDIVTVGVDSISARPMAAVIPPR